MLSGGGFMARSWGDGSPTQPLHHIAFDMYEDLAKTLQCKSYRKLPVISVSPEGGSISRIQPMGYGDDTAQITPKGKQNMSSVWMACVTTN